MPSPRRRSGARPWDSAALRPAAKQGRNTLADRTLTRVFDPPLNKASPFMTSSLRIRVGRHPLTPSS